MQSDKTPSAPPAGGGTSSSNNRNLLIALGLAGVALAGIGAVIWFGRQTTVKRKRSPKGKKGKKSEGKKGTLVSSDDARITLDKVARLQPDQIQAEIERAEREGDKASQINIFFLLATGLLRQQQPLQQAHVETAVKYYSIALQYAEDINSDMRGPILLELATLASAFQNHRQAVTMFEQGLHTFLDMPDDEMEGDIVQQLSIIFSKLSECYANTKGHKRGIDFMLDYLKRTEGRKLHDELLPSVMLWVAESEYALKNYEGCISRLEGILAKEDKLPADLEMGYNYFLAWSNSKAERNEAATKYFEKYLELAKQTKAPVESTIEPIMALIVCYNELGQREQCGKTIERALQEIDQLDEAQQPLMCLKHLYFLGLYCLNKFGEIERARTLLERAFNLAKTNTALSAQMPWGTIAIDLAEAYHKLKLRDEAIKIIDTGLTALREGEKSLLPPALIRQARIFSELGDKAKAVNSLEEALKVAQQLTPGNADEVNSRWLCRFLKFQLGKMYTLMGQLSKARALLMSSLADFADTSDREMHSVVLATIASNLAQSGDREQALQKIQEVLDMLAAPTTEKFTQVDIRTELGECYLFLDDYLQAKKELTSALEDDSEKGEKSTLLVEVRLAHIYDWLGESGRALECLSRADKYKERDESVIHLGSVSVGHAMHHHFLGDITNAQIQAEKAARYLDEACCGSTPLNVLSLHGLLAETNFWSNRMEDSIKHFQRCLDHISTNPCAKENIVSILNVQTRLAALALYMENKDQDANALSMLRQLLPLARAKGSIFHVAHLLALTGLAIARALNDEPEATTLFTEALSSAEKSADRRVLALVNRLAGSFYSRYATDKAEEGKKHLDHALALARELGDQLLETIVLRDLAITAVKEETGSEEDKERVWKAATTSAQEIAERSGNKYLVNLLAHYSSHAPSSPSPPTFGQTQEENRAAPEGAADPVPSTQPEAEPTSAPAEEDQPVHAKPEEEVESAPTEETQAEPEQETTAESSSPDSGKDEKITIEDAQDEDEEEVSHDE